jgi:hypothetical protein
MRSFSMKLKFSIAMILLLAFQGQGYSCSCGHMGIEKEVDTAYDFIIAKVISEKIDSLNCTYFLDYSYVFEIQFSYKGQLKGKSTIFGGKGGGACGAIFETGKEYLLVVRKCDRGLYTLLCSDNQLTANASTQIEFLNRHFNKNYQQLQISLLVPIVITFLVLTATGLVTFNFYKKRLGMKR